MTWRDISPKHIDGWSLWFNSHDSHVQIGRSVQSRLGHISDAQEKIINLVMWERPEQTRRVVELLVAAAVVALVVPTSMLITALQVAGVCH